MSNNKGLDTTVDTAVLNGLIVSGNMFCKDTLEISDSISTIARKMEDDESLKGGDGDQIRESFSQIAVGAKNVSKSAKQITHVLNDKLDKALKAKQGRFGADSSSQAKTATAKAGIQKKE